MENVEDGSVGDEHWHLDVLSVGKCASLNIVQLVIGDFGIQLLDSVSDVASEVSMGFQGESLDKSFGNNVCTSSIHSFASSEIEVAALVLSVLREGIELGDLSLSNGNLHVSDLCLALSGVWVISTDHLLQKECVKEIAQQY